MCGESELASIPFTRFLPTITACHLTADEDIDYPAGSLFSTARRRIWCTLSLNSLPSLCMFVLLRETHDDNDEDIMTMKRIMWKDNDNTGHFFLFLLFFIFLKLPPILPILFYILLFSFIMSFVLLFFLPFLPPYPLLHSLSLLPSLS